MVATISENRTKIMGLCIGVIMLYHHPLCSIIPGMSFGCLGVDVFLFLSGFGLYFSLKASEEKHQTILSFYKRRFVRIMPAAIIAGLLLKWNGNFSSLSECLAFSGLGLWYIRAILILYLFSPLFYRIISRSSCGSIMLIYGICIIGIVFLSMYVFQSLFSVGNMTFTWALARTPAFLMGMLVPAGMNLPFNVSNKLKIVIKICSALLAWRLISVFLTPNINPLIKELSLYFGWFLFSFCIPELCLLLVRVISFLNVKLQSILSWMGIMSLELYLVHESIYAYVGGFKPASCLVRWGSMVLISFIAAWLLNKICANLKFWRFFRKSKKTCTNS